jgi:hypothetical protein
MVEGLGQASVHRVAVECIRLSTILCLLDQDREGRAMILRHRQEADTIQSVQGEDIREVPGWEGVHLTPLVDLGMETLFERV